MHANSLALVLAAILALALSDCGSADPAQAPDVIYHGGTIITMAGETPTTVEAVAVKGGKIVAVGEAASLLRTASDATRQVDLQGKTMLPGFVDSHSHVYMGGLQASSANLLPPPDGEGSSVAKLQELLRAWVEENPRTIERVGWIGGFGYDDSQLAERRHPTKEELDAVSTEHPVVIIHQSGHIGVFNSKALEMGGITAETPDPAGGVFRRVAGSNEPTGVCEEYAFFQMLGLLASRFDDTISERLAEEGVRLMASFGYTTAQEGRAMAMSRDAIARVGKRGGLPIDVVVYPDILEVPDISPSRTYEGRFRVGGAKLTIDGSPQGKTAWLTAPYHVPPEGRPADYRGYAAIDADTARAAVEKAFANGWQILCHSNGDAASDLFIEAVAAAREKHPSADVRPVLIHGQVLRRDQVVRLDELGIFPSLFPMHTFYWGDWHVESVLGPERAENISPTGWVRERGMMFGSHHDAPVALPDSMRVLSATVTRTTRSGKVLGAEHRVSVYDALRALTIWPAWQHFEENAKGTIEVGKLADFVVLSDNPLTIPQDQLDDLKVLETIKEGETVYTRPARTARVQPAAFGIAVVDAPPHDHHGHGDGCLNPALDALVSALQTQDEARR